MADTIETARLELVPSTLEMLRAELDDRSAPGRFLNARVPDDYPPAEYDADAIRWMIGLLEQQPGAAKWWVYYVVWTVDERTLVGGVGFKGPPVDGAVEIGYSVVGCFQRRGIATDAVRAIVSHAFAHPEIDRVEADTFPELIPSIGVLEKCGFRHIGDGPEPRTIRYRVTREGLQDC